MPRLGSTFVIALVAAVGVAATPAAAASKPGSGSLVATQGKAGKKAFKAHKLRLKATKPAKWSRGRLTLPVARLSVSTTAKATLGGRLTFTAGRRSVRFTALELTVARGNATVTGKTGKRRIALLRSKVTVKSSRGTARLDRKAGTVSVQGGTVALTSSAAAVLRKRLKLKRLRAFTFGTTRASAKPKPASTPTAPGGSGGGGGGGGSGTPTPPPQPTDPYASICPVGAVSGPGQPPASTPNPGPPQPLPGKPVAATDVVSGSVVWGFKESFRTYVRTIALGTITARGGGASVDAAGISTYPVGAGWIEGLADPLKYTRSDAGGTVLYCSIPHGFWYSMSDPTVVITPGTGEARLQLTIDTNQSGNYYGPKRVDFATLTLPAPSSTSGKTTTWTNVPTKITADGQEYFESYAAGTDLDPITVTATTP